MFDLYPQFYRKLNTTQNLTISYLIIDDEAILYIQLGKYENITNEQLTILNTHNQFSVTKKYNFANQIL